MSQARSFRAGTLWRRFSALARSMIPRYVKQITRAGRLASTAAKHSSLQEGETCTCVRVLTLMVLVAYILGCLRVFHRLRVSSQRRILVPILLHIQAPAASLDGSAPVRRRPGRLPPAHPPSLCPLLQPDRVYCGQSEGPGRQSSLNIEAPSLTIRLGRITQLFDSTITSNRGPKRIDAPRTIAPFSIATTDDSDGKVEYDEWKVDVLRDCVNKDGDSGLCVYVPHIV